MSGRIALLADIGGTHARFALADAQADSPLREDSVQQYEVAAFASLDAAAAHYLSHVGQAQGSVHDGVFAVAGRVEGDQARITNHPWTISCTRSRAELGLDSLRLVNDFAAQAMAVELLGARDLAAIGTRGAGPATPERTCAVIGPGTGLGVSALIVREGRGHVLETEGGHVSFAATDALEAAVLGRLAARFGRVSNERLVSGTGLVNLHDALSELDGVAPVPMRPRDVSEGAARGDARCVRALDLFCAVFGAIAGDLVLTLGAWDGVYLTGGLVPRLLETLQHSRFRERFEAKGRFTEAMANVPTLAVLHPQAGLLGAAAFARRDYTAGAAP
jgi:glucokinase